MGQGSARHRLTLAASTICLSFVATLSTSAGAATISSSIRSLRSNLIGEGLVTANWSVVAATQTGSNTQSALSLNLAKGKGSLFYVKNWGSIAVSSFTMTQQLKGGNVARIYYCGTGGFSNLDAITCADGSTAIQLMQTVGGKTSSALVSAFSIDVGAAVPLDVLDGGVTTDTISIAVSRSDVRAATTSTS